MTAGPPPIPHGESNISITSTMTVPRLDETTTTMATTRTTTTTPPEAGTTATDASVDADEGIPDVPSTSMLLDTTAATTTVAATSSPQAGETSVENLFDISASSITDRCDDEDGDVDKDIGGEEPSDGSRPISTTSDVRTQTDTTTTHSMTTNETRDVGSVGDDESSRSKRETLRYEIDRRRSALTRPERAFLELLIVEGDDVEVELAMNTLTDEELFFEYATPRHLRCNPTSVDRVSAPSNLDDDYNFYNDDNDDQMIKDYRNHSSSSGFSRRYYDDDDASREQASVGSQSFSSSNHLQDGTATDGNNPIQLPPYALARHGSAKRMEVLLARRSSNDLGKIWRAHETGLAVTTVASRKSLQLRRESSFGGASGLSSGTSIASRRVADIFRRHDQKTSTGGDGSGMMVSASPPTQNGVVGGMPPPRPPGTTTRRPYLRSKSMGTSSLSRNGTGRVVPSPSSTFNKQTSNNGLVPRVPGPRNFNGRSSTGGSARKSVTFHQMEEVLEIDDDSDGFDEEKKETSADNASDTPKTTNYKKLPNQSKVLRRALSDSVLRLHGDEQPRLGTADGTSMETTTTIEMIPAVPKSDSIPSLHHAHPLRQDSISSIPSLHHGHPVREPSMPKIPSIHHAHPIRQDSISSIPSLHHGRPLSPDSESQLDSSIGRVHRAWPFRASDAGSIPSLHHGHPLQSQEDLDQQVPDGRGQSVSPGIIQMQLAASEDIANAWLQQRKDTIRGRGDSLGSLPHDITIPIADTTMTKMSSTTDGLDETGVSAVDETDPSSSEPGVSTKPILMRLASKNVYDGEGIEVTEMEDQPIGYGYLDTSLVSISLRTVNSYDDDLTSAMSGRRRTSDIFRRLRRTVSDDDMSSIFLIPREGTGGRVVSPFGQPDTVGSAYGEDVSETDASWEMNSEYSGRFDAWNIIQDDYVNGYGGGGTLGFSILGTCADDESAQPHVLSPPLMESLQAFLPYTKSGQNFYLKYSMVRDGAALPTLLKRARGVQYSILAIETVDGEVFGCFTAQPWRKNWNYFGSGESFLWKMRHSRLEKTHGILEQAQRESEVDVYPYTGENRFVQLCTHDRIAVGGGMPSGEKKFDDPGTSSTFVKDHEWGFGLAIQSDMFQGTSSPCVTFGSPSLSNVHSDGSRFEIINIELWTLTPCQTVEEAEKLELGKLFLQRDPTIDSLPYGY